MIPLIIQLNYVNVYNVWTGVGNMWGEEDRMRSYYYANSGSSSPFWFIFYSIFPLIFFKNFQAMWLLNNEINMWDIMLSTMPGKSAIMRLTLQLLMEKSIYKTISKKCFWKKYADFKISFKNNYSSFSYLEILLECAYILRRSNLHILKYAKYIY